MTGRVAIFAYGVACYAVFFGTFLYTFGFVGNLAVPKSIDSAPRVGLGWALLVNALLVSVFALQHSVMARPAFKRWWTRIVPHAAERSTYVLFTSLALILLFWKWEPMGGVVWNIENSAGRAVMLGFFVAGWLIVLATTFLINHFDLFGMRQVWLHLRGRDYTPLGFVTPGPYKRVRHPLYVGWLTAFWATPTMTVAHLVFAVLLTAYILVAIRFEEKDLAAFHGRAYEEYRRAVPMLIPRASRPRAGEKADAGRKPEPVMEVA